MFEFLTAYETIGVEVILKHRSILNSKVQTLHHDTDLKEL